MKLGASFFLLLSLLSTGCGSSERAKEDDGAWLGTITTEGDVTTVVTEAGSVWGGDATLVEEASIGVAEGEEPYMLSQVMSVAVSDERIWVLERRPPVLRVYDLDGVHVRDIGSAGQGPGELSRPESVAIGPDGRVFVRDGGNNRISIFTADGELLETWPLPGDFGTREQTVITEDSDVYTPQPMPGERRSSEPLPWGFARRGPEGQVGDVIAPPTFDYEQPFLRSERRRGIVPYYPRPVARLSPLGAMVAGVGEPYEIEVRFFDGRVMRVVRRIDPVPIGSEEAAWHERAETAYWKEDDPSWSWSGPGVPDHKPFFDDLYADPDGRIWVRRKGSSRRIDDCDEYPEPGARIIRCWEDTYALEVFGGDGRFLGEVDLPPSFGIPGFLVIAVRGDTIVKLVQDEAGTPMVKRYRLALPQEGRL